MSGGIICPVCGSYQSVVRDSRPVLGGSPRTIWRRRHCPEGHVYTTREITEGVFVRLTERAAALDGMLSAVGLSLPELSPEAETEGGR